MRRGPFLESQIGGMNMSINWQEIVFNFWEAWALSHSIKTMGEGLQQAAGDRLDTILII